MLLITWRSTNAAEYDSNTDQIVARNLTQMQALYAIMYEFAELQVLQSYVLKWVRITCITTLLQSDVVKCFLVNIEMINRGRLDFVPQNCYRLSKFLFTFASCKMILLTNRTVRETIIDIDEISSLNHLWHCHGMANDRKLANEVILLF